jgi:hypothetical protein
MSKETFIVSGTYSEYKHYCEHHRGTFTYLTHLDQLKGVKKPKFILVGTFGDNPLIRDNKLKEYGF